MENNIKLKYLLVILILMSFSGCNHNIDSSQELLQWINNPDKGLLKSKTINGFKLTAKYLPPAYLAWNEVKGKPFNQNVYDSILQRHNRSRTFLLTIAPDEGQEQSNVMFYKIMNETDYKKRVAELNFNVGNFISIRTDKEELPPLLHTLENTYELAKHKTIYLVFANHNNTGDLLSSEKLDLKFRDEIFDTGISHFIFHKKDIESIPEIHIKKFKALNRIAKSNKL